ncbi:MAG: hypothetical protein PHH21_02090 [Candidatus Pacebacteria bacterium]|nr:hypothetical protein [Candidatus Paceibacterota bacterium]
MNRDILFILIIFVLVIAGVYLVFFNKATLSNDASFNLLKNLDSQVKVGFSNIEARTFVWNFENEGEETTTQAIAGKGFTAVGITNKETEAVKGYFEENGFKIDFFDIDPETLSGIAGYKKDKDVCVVKTTVWKDDQGMPMAVDKLDTDVSCGQLEE